MISRTTFMSAAAMIALMSVVPVGSAVDLNSEEQFNDIYDDYDLFAELPIGGQERAAPG